jgi:hypothetical protein
MARPVLEMVSLFMVRSPDHCLLSGKKYTHVGLHVKPTRADIALDSDELVRVAAAVASEPR